MILILSLLFFMCKPVFADVYVVYDKDTKEIKSVSNYDDAQLDQGWKKKVIPGKVENYSLSQPLFFYRLENDIFVLDTDKVTAAQDAEKDAKKKAKEMQKIQQRALKNAMKELEGEGVQFEQVQETDFDKEVQ